MGRRAHPCPTMDSMTLGVIERACAEWRDHLRAIGRAESPGAKPRYDTMLKLLHALGVKLSASPVNS